MQIHRNPYVLLTVAWFNSDDNVVYNVFPVLWMTSCFHIMGAWAGKTSVC